jgi:riboflavin biosynthesis pyrimidine reductase
MPEVLLARYGGPLEIPVHPGRPTLLVNFVTTIDGIAALGLGEEAGGGVISGYFAPDRFVMALLRAVADLLLFGARTIAGSSSTDWTAEHLQPDLAPAIRQWRHDLGLAPRPTTVIVTGSGDVRLGRRGVDDPDRPVVFATTPSGERRLRERGLPPHVIVEVVGSGDRVRPDELSSFLARYRGQVVLSEGGPHLLAGLVAADLVDEIFLTLAPQVIGHDGDRLGLVEGVRLPAGDARWHELASVKRAGDHLFLRYRRARVGAR